MSIEIDSTEAILKIDSRKSVQQVVAKTLVVVDEKSNLEDDEIIRNETTNDTKSNNLKSPSTSTGSTSNCLNDKCSKQTNTIIVLNNTKQISSELDDNDNDNNDVWFDLPNDTNFDSLKNNASLTHNNDNNTNYYESCIEDNYTTHTNSYNDDDSNDDDETVVENHSYRQCCDENTVEQNNDTTQTNSTNRNLSSEIQATNDDIKNTVTSNTIENNCNLRTSLHTEEYHQRSMSTTGAEGTKQEIHQQQQQQHQEPNHHKKRSSDNSSIVEGSIPRRRTSNKSKKHVRIDSLDPLVLASSSAAAVTSTAATATTTGTSSNNVLRSVQKVGQHAAQTTKHAVWDTNELSITAALNAVDQWETLYHTVRQLIVLALTNTTNFYDSIKVSLSSSNNNHTTTNNNEHENMYISFVRFIRDWIAIPTLHGMEQLILTSISFIRSSQAQTIANQSMNLIQHIPFIGSTILVPCIGTTGSILHTIWITIQYPIPSKTIVRNNVDKVMTGMKWMIRTCWTEVVYYIQRADANITRTLSHTQWKVLGSGPYETLPDDSKVLVINHMCERYYTLANSVTSRYELAAHVKRHNPLLYIDLVSTGIWKERGGSITCNDEWLNYNPTYRIRQSCQEHDDNLVTNTIVEPYLLSPISFRTIDQDSTIRDAKTAYEREDTSNNSTVVCSPLWFRLPNINGERPPADTQWIPLSIHDQHTLDENYLNLLRHTTDDTAVLNSVVDDSVQVDKEQRHPPRHAAHSKPTHKTIAQWYDTSASAPTSATQYNKTAVRDILVDQKRHSVTLQLDRAECIRQRYLSDISTATSCNNIATPNAMKDMSKWNFVPPKLNAVYRPNFWRFYGPGDDVRRAVWVIDIPGKGLQPFDDDAHSILEDAFLFLQWSQDSSNSRRHRRIQLKQNPNDEDDQHVRKDVDTNTSSSYDGDLLTVEVNCPDGATRLVQFSSRTRVTAIQQGLYASMSLFKLRVYRGVWLQSKTDLLTNSNQSNRTIVTHDKFLDVVEEHGLLGDTIVPNMSLRELLLGPQGFGDESQQNITSISDDDDNDDNDGEYCLVAPRDRCEEDDLANYLYDIACGNETDNSTSSDDVDHLVLVVHGIGEMLRSADFMFGLAMPSLSSIVDCCGYMRKNHAEIQKQNMLNDPIMNGIGQTIDNSTPDRNSNSRKRDGRVEYLPVEWHEAFAILSQRRVAPPPNPNKPYVMINDISLKTIPNMRNFANDTLMDVLYFMSPEHHDTIVEVVVNEMNFLVNKFRTITNFKGTISIIGHSLGSIISWDILAMQPDDDVESVVADESPLSVSFPSINEGPATTMPTKMVSTTLSSPFGSSDSLGTNIDNYNTSTCTGSPRLNFPVSNFFMVGSPVAVFLMIRNQRMPLTDDYYLPGCRNVYNVFHPYDPVAYRIEPCIDPRNSDTTPEIIRHWNGGYRMHYQTRRMWQKLVETTRKTQNEFVGAFEEKMTRIGLLGGSGGNNNGVGVNGNPACASTLSATTTISKIYETDSCTDDSASEMSGIDNNDNNINNNQFGMLNRGMRIDYMLQESEIETANEYVAALAAHSSYWPEKDLSLFIATQILQ